MQLQKLTSSTYLDRQNMTMAANDTNEFKKIKLIQIQIFCKVKRHIFVLMC